MCSSDLDRSGARPRPSFLTSTRRLGASATERLAFRCATGLRYVPLTTPHHPTPLPETYHLLNSYETPSGCQAPDSRHDDQIAAGLATWRLGVLQLFVRPNPVTRNLPLVPSSQTPSGLKSAGERNVPLPPPVLNGESAFPLSGTERGTGGEDRNGEGESPACTGRAVPDRLFT